MGQEAEESCRFWAPPAPCFDGEDHEPAPSGTEKFWVCALLGFACAAPAYWPARLRGWLEEVKGDTRVVSTASCEPRPGHMLRDGRLMGLKCDGTDRCGLTEAVGDVGVGGVGHGRGERDRWCLIQRGWW